MSPAREVHGLVTGGVARRTLGERPGWALPHAPADARRRLEPRFGPDAPPSSGPDDDALGRSGEVVGGERSDVRLGTVFPLYQIAAASLDLTRDVFELPASYLT